MQAKRNFIGLELFSVTELVNKASKINVLSKDLKVFYKIKTYSIKS